MGLAGNEKVAKVKKEARCNQKLKIMYLMKILMENTDEEHAITLVEIVSKLKEYGISAERKSIYKGQEIVDEIRYIVKNNWQMLAKKQGISRNEIVRMEPAFMLCE